MQRNLVLLGAVVLSDALIAPGWLPVPVGKNSFPVLGQSSLARGDSRRGLGCTKGRGADTVDDAARGGTVSPKSLIPGDILAASRKRAAEAATTMRMSKLIGRAAGQMAWSSLRARATQPHFRTMTCAWSAVSLRGSCPFVLMKQICSVWRRSTPSRTLLAPLTHAILVRRSWASLRSASPRRRADITELCSLLVHDSNSRSSWARAGGAGMVLFRVRLAQ